MIRVSVSQLDAYLSKFRLRLSHDHLLRLQKLRVSLHAIQQFTVEWKKAKSGEGALSSHVAEVMSVRELVGRMGKNIEGINLLDIRSYLENSKVPAIHVSQNLLSPFSRLLGRLPAIRMTVSPTVPLVLPSLIIF